MNKWNDAALSAFAAGFFASREGFDGDEMLSHLAPRSLFSGTDLRDGLTIHDMRQRVRDDEDLWRLFSEFMRSIGGKVA